MLTNLQVRDFAIVDRIDVELGPGMTVLTGETGAGKSILVDALGLVLGERGSSQVIRQGAERAEFTAEFDVSGLPAVIGWLADNALDAAGECVVRRVINADGRSRAFINGNAVPLSQLKALGEMLVDIHGQHFHQSLGRPGVQLELLDFFGGLTAKQSATGQAFDEWQRLGERLRQLTTADADRESRLDLLRFQIGELEALALGDGEFDALTAERSRLANSGRLAEGLSRILEQLSLGDELNAAGLIANASRTLESLAALDDALTPAGELLDSAGIHLDEAIEALQRYADSVDTHSGRRDWVEERLDAARKLARKHRIEGSELPARLAALRAELSELGDAGETSRKLTAEAEAAEERYFALADELSIARQNAAACFSRAVTGTMAGLGMPGGLFEVACTHLPPEGARRSGIDRVEFLISANPGQPLLPLARIASGGELSRMSLAIQVIASNGTHIPTMVFDEVDSGVGGGVAEMVGRRLSELGQHRQVLCVTHLPQVASLAHQHVRISKSSDGKSTRAGVEPLADGERVEELARMLGGVKITRKTREHAAEMLADAPKRRASPSSA